MVSLLGSEEAPDGEVEILIEGKRYQSTRDYKREKFKEALSQQLSENILRDFSDDEILDIIADIRASHQTEKSIPPLPQASPQDLITPSTTLPVDTAESPGSDGSEMQNMLKKYQLDHAEAETVTIDPDKVKNIFIQPKEQTGNHEN